MPPRKKPTLLAQSKPCTLGQEHPPVGECGCTPQDGGTRYQVMHRATAGDGKPWKRIPRRARGGSPKARFQVIRKLESWAIAHETITGYLDTLERLRLTENSPAWRPHMRSKTPLRTAEVRYFVDPSLGPAALGIRTSELRSDPLATGFHLEALVVRDLRIFAQSHNGRVESWRDKNGNEVDAIVSISENRWAAFEIKLNPRHVDEAAVSLLRFAANADKDRHKEPAALGVITSADGQRPDGVHVIPIGALGP